VSVGSLAVQSGPDAGAAAPAPALLHLKKLKCVENNRSGARRSAFVAALEIELFIQFEGINRCADLMVTAPDCLSLREFQKRWRSFHRYVVKPLFNRGHWIRERQPRSGNWHGHGPVVLPFDIREGFPWEEVLAKNYQNVDPRLKAIWKQLREGAERYGLGWVSLLPIRSTGPKAARYFTKYILKRVSTDLLKGEERCRCYGSWGGIKRCSQKFSYVSQRIKRARLSWARDVLGLRWAETPQELLGPFWWERLWPTLSRVIMPSRYYETRRADGKWHMDDIGCRAWATNYNECPAPTLLRKIRLSRMQFFVAYYSQLGCSMRKACRLAGAKLNESGLLEQPLLPEMSSPHGTPLPEVKQRDEPESPFK
jgi:hypothetical protein